MAEDTKKIPVTIDEIATIEKDIDMFAGWLKRLENPDPVLRSEAAGKGLKLYDEVERDAHAGSVLQQRAMAVVGKEWEIIPAKSARKMGRPSSTTQEQVIADFVSQTLMDCNFDQARQELLKAILYGHYETEIIWQHVGGSLRIKKMIGKHPRRFVFTPQRELRLLTLQNMIDGEALPERKFITFTYGDSDNPYGKGLGQSIWWPVWFKKHGIKFWMVFLEKFGMPTTVGKYPSGTLAPAKKTLLDAIESIQTDTGITMPDNMSVEFLEASRTGKVTHEQLCEYMDKQISKRVLGQTATTEGTEGKLGNEDAQGETKQEITEADADLLDSCLNDTLIKWIVDYNFPNVTAYPKIQTYANGKPDLSARAEIDKTLVVDIGLPVAVDYFYSTYGIPAPQEGDILVQPAKPKPMPDNKGTAPQFAEGDSDDVADYLADQLAAAAMPESDKLMAQLKKLTDTADSLEDLRDGIVDIFADLNPVDLGETITRALMLAEMSGRYEVSTEKKSPEFAEEGISPSLMAAFKLPFKEQETFFQNKINIPTRKWDDLWKDQHAKGFMVAGAYKADLLSDFRGAVDKAITDGVTLEKFRKDFDGIVARHGWSYNGTRNWRSEIIYSTNVRQSYNAGRWAQLTDPEQLQVMPYLTYKHGDSKNPRQQHLAWDGLTLPAEDPFWETHYPQNGWGCKCRVYSSTRKEYQAAKNKGKAKAPPSPIDPKTGEQVGIDKGFGFNIGKAAQTNSHDILAQNLSRWPADIGSRAMAEMKAPARKVIEENYDAFIKRKLGGEKTNHAFALLGTMEKAEIKFLTQKGKAPQSAGIVLNDRLVVGKKAARHLAVGNALTESEWINLQKNFGTQAVLYDLTDGKLLYVSPSEGDPRVVKVVVAMDVMEKKLKGTINEATSVFKLDKQALEDRTKYELVRGKI